VHSWLIGNQIPADKRPIYDPLAGYGVTAGDAEVSAAAAELDRSAKTTRTKPTAKKWTNSDDSA
ncbi:MAG: hypothetical protein ACR2M4_02335, partial [Actinomycetota bacterium]